MLVRVLRREDEERRGQGARRAVHRHLPLGHRLEQTALGARGGAVDLVGEHEVREERTRLEDELPAALLVDGDAGDVAGEQVARELDAREGQVERPR